MPRRRHCPWCGTALAERTGAGRPRETCGKARCRRLNAAYRRREDEYARRLDEQKALTEQAVQRLLDFAREVSSRASAVAEGIQNVQDMTGPHARLDPARKARLLEDALADHVLPRVKGLADYVRAAAADVRPPS